MSKNGTQREIIYNLIVVTLKEMGIRFEIGDCLITDLHHTHLYNLKRAVQVKIQEEIASGNIVVSDPEKAKDHGWRVGYAGKILSERLRKDRRLNGDLKHLTKAKESGFPTSEQYVWIKVGDLVAFAEGMGASAKDIPLPPPVRKKRPFLR